MIDPGFLARAVARGIITADQSDALERLDREAMPATVEGAEDERVRLVTGFADIFATLGLALFLWAARLLATLALSPAATWALVAVLAWGLAEFFTRRRRMALPSLVLLGVFAGAVFSATTELLGSGAGFAAEATDGASSLVLAGAALATLVLMGLHYRRFAVPITVAAGAAALSGLVFALAAAALPTLPDIAGRGLIVLAGLGVFALGMRYDLSDRERVTRRADIAFWLHLLAAPMIVHPALWEMREALSTGVASTAFAAAVLAVVLALALVALAIDRRALLLAGLAYTGYALADLMVVAGLGGAAIPVTLLVLGAFMLLLSGGWTFLRRLVLRGLPTRLAARLPHPIGIS